MSERCSVCGLRKDEPAGSSACNWGNMHRPSEATVSAASFEEHVDLAVPSGEFPQHVAMRLCDTILAAYNDSGDGHSDRPTLDRWNPIVDYARILKGELTATKPTAPPSREAELRKALEWALYALEHADYVTRGWLETVAKAEHAKARAALATPMFAACKEVWAAWEASQLKEKS